MVELLNRKMSRRGFVGGFTALGFVAAYSGQLPLPSAEGNTTVPQPTPSPEAPKPELTVEQMIDPVNQIYGKRPSSPKLAYGFTFETPLETAAEVEDVYDNWGKTVIVNNPSTNKPLEVPKFNIAMYLLNTPIIEQISTTGPFLAYEMGDTQYEFEKTENGYKALQTTVERATIAEELPEDESDITRNMPLETKPIEEVTVSGEQYKAPRDEDFDDAIQRLNDTYGETYLNKFSKELYPYIKNFYNMETVDLATTDGMFPYNTNADIFDPDELGPVFNLPNMAHYSHHALIMQVALKTIVKEYRGAQMYAGELKENYELRSDLFLQREKIKPRIYAYPYGIQDFHNFLPIEDPLDKIPEDEQDKFPSITVFSTLNRKEKIKLLKPMPKGAICVTTVRKDKNGELYMPENRSYVENEDLMFGFPDETVALSIQFGADNTNGDVELFHRYKAIMAAGASLSTLQATAFIGAVVSKLLKDGHEYSEKHIMNTLRQLCPPTMVGEARLRVPDMKEVEKFFQPDLHLPNIIVPKAA